MVDFINKIILDNPLVDYLMAAGFILLVIVLKKSASKKITRVIFYVFRKMGRLINEQEFFDLVLVPLERFIVFLAIYFAVGELNFPSALAVKIFYIQLDVIVDRTLIGILLYLFFNMLLRVIDYLAVIMEKRVAATREMNDDQLIIFFREFLKVILIIFCILLIIRFVFNQDITNFLAGLSLAGAAIALAAKESLENLIASFIIFFDKPFSVGDLLKVNQVNGTVEKIGLRSTRIRTVEKTYVTIPNKQMVDSVVDNLSLRNKRRAELILNLNLKTSAAQLTQLVNKIDELLSDQKVTDKSVLLSDIKIDAYVIVIEYFTEVITFADFNVLKQRINFLILELLEREGVDVAGKDKLIGPRLG